MKRRDFLKLSSLIGSSIFIPEITFAKSKDIFIPNKDIATFNSIRMKLNNTQRIIGHGNFSVISFDALLTYGRKYSKIGNFTKEEILFMEKIFYEDPLKYGFKGERTVKEISQNIKRKDIVKIPKTGQFLFKGDSEDKYHQLKKDIGKNMILTSGVRSVPKQMKLYLDKIHRCNGNISEASFSLAPPGYSYHSISDFDVGKKGFGSKNFTSEFAKTKEFKKLSKLEYINIRYIKDNKDGVRFEPWHVEVNS